jgi:long-subunit acyl-CoA synthetase (AMP-forming)
MSRLLERLAACAPERIVLTDGQHHVTAGEGLAEVVALQRVLRAASQGRVVAMDAEDSPAWVLVDLACLAAGIPLLPLPAFFTPAQRQHALQDAGAGVLISSQGEGQPLAVAGHTLHIQPLDYPAKPLPAGTAKITYTSGSTGTPKGVCLSAAHLEEVACSLAEELGQYAGYHRTLLPLAVLLENIAGVYVSLACGAVCHVASVAPDGPSIARALQESAATTCIFVPEMLKRLLASEAALPALRFAAVGGAKVSPQLLSAARAAGLPVYEGYGLSEAGSVIAVNHPEAERLGSVGRCLPHVRMHTAPDGELVLEHPRMLGYLGEGAACPNPYRTGDLALFDADGFLYLTGRRKHVLITGFGRNVSPEWVESELLAEPAIAQACVFGDGEAALQALLVPARAGADIASAVARANARLPEYAHVAQWQSTEAFTPANGLLTTNGRPKREAILRHHARASHFLGELSV